MSDVECEPYDDPNYRVGYTEPPPGWAPAPYGAPLSDLNWGVPDPSEAPPSESNYQYPTDSFSTSYQSVSALPTPLYSKPTTPQAVDVSTRNSVILLVGPGGEAWQDFENDVKSCEMMLNEDEGMRDRYTIVGDGKRDCTKSEILEGFRSHAVKWRGENITIIISSHGSLSSQGQHELQFNKAYPTNTEGFLRDYIAGSLGRELQAQADLHGIMTTVSETGRPKTDVVLAACYSASALSSARHLEPGSCVVAAAYRYACKTYLTDSFEWLRDMRRRCGGPAIDITGQAMLDAQLMSGGNCQSCKPTSPSYAISTGNSCEIHRLQSEFKKRCGTPFTSAEVDWAKFKFGLWISDNREQGRRTVSNLMDKIGKTTSKRGVKDHEHLLALAICGESPVVDGGEPPGTRGKREAMNVSRGELVEEDKRAWREWEQKSREAQETSEQGQSTRQGRDGSRRRRRSRTDKRGPQRARPKESWLSRLLQ